VSNLSMGPTSFVLQLTRDSCYCSFSYFVLCVRLLCLVFFLLNSLDVLMHLCDECSGTNIVNACWHFVSYQVSVTVRYLHSCYNHIAVFINYYHQQKMKLCNSDKEVKDLLCLTVQLICTKPRLSMDFI